ncbi:MAG: hypothetical protein LLF89_08515 [Spirochaetaceae bacterium]|nr:hypothetical protein [Spirochaetaceae bacterium]
MSFAFSPSAGSKLYVQINSNYTEISGAEGIPEFGAEKGTYDITSIGDSAKSFATDMPDYGEVTITGIWDSTDAAHAHLLTSAASSASTDVFKAEFAKKAGGSAAASAIFSGLVLSFRVSAAKGSPQKFTSKIKLTGAVNWTAAS